MKLFYLITGAPNDHSRNNFQKIFKNSNNQKKKKKPKKKKKRKKERKILAIQSAQIISKTWFNLLSKVSHSILTLRYKNHG